MLAYGLLIILPNYIPKNVRQVNGPIVFSAAIGIAHHLAKFMNDLVLAFTVLASWLCLMGLYFIF
jgi:hypothetical protein